MPSTTREICWFFLSMSTRQVSIYLLTAATRTYSINRMTISLSNYAPIFEILQISPRSFWNASIKNSRDGLKKIPMTTHIYRRRLNFEDRLGIRHICSLEILQLRFRARKKHLTVRWYDSVLVRRPPLHLVRRRILCSQNSSPTLNESWSWFSRSYLNYAEVNCNTSCDAGI